MGIRSRIDTAFREAEAEGDSDRASILRLIDAAIRDRDAARRGMGQESGIDDDELREILARMAARRRESAREYEEAARLDQAETKRAEAALIEEFLPTKLDDDRLAAAIDDAMAETGAESIRDLGRVMALLKQRYAGRADFTEVGRQVKSRLS